MARAGRAFARRWMTVVVLGGLSTACGKLFAFDNEVPDESARPSFVDSGGALGADGGVRGDLDARSGEPDGDAADKADGAGGDAGSDAAEAGATIVPYKCASKHSD